MPRVVRLNRAQFGFRIAEAAHWWRKLLDERLKPLGLSQAKWVTLYVLAKAGGSMTQKDLALARGIEGPTLVRLLDGLAAAGLVERRPDPTDRRSKTVHLTPEARPILRKIDRIAAGLRDELLNGISDEQVDVCLKVFDAVQRNAGGYPVAPVEDRAGIDDA